VADKLVDIRGVFSVSLVAGCQLEWWNASSVDAVIACGQVMRPTSRCCRSLYAASTGDEWTFLSYDSPVFSSGNYYFAAKTSMLYRPPRGVDPLTSDNTPSSDPKPDPLYQGTSSLK